MQAPVDVLRRAAMSLKIFREGFDGLMVLPSGSEQKASLVQIKKEGNVILPSAG